MTATSMVQREPTTRRRPPTARAPKPPTIRCAIYTRKSSEEGLAQEFNSLDAQREAAESYIASQKAEGWVALPDRYDDGGYTGGNMERPALKKLLSDVQAGKIDCIIVYKVDRLSRSLMVRRASSPGPKCRGASVSDDCFEWGIAERGSTVTAENIVNGRERAVGSYPIEPRHDRA